MRFDDPIAHVGADGASSAEVAAISGNLVPYSQFVCSKALQGGPLHNCLLACCACYACCACCARCVRFRLKCELYVTKFDHQRDPTQLSTDDIRPIKFV